jgi:hypothetical protein
MVWKFSPHYTSYHFHKYLATLSGRNVTLEKSFKPSKRSLLYRDTLTFLEFNLITVVVPPGYFVFQVVNKLIWKASQAIVSTQ